MRTPPRLSRLPDTSEKDAVEEASRRALVGIWKASARRTTQNEEPTNQPTTEPGLVKMLATVFSTCPLLMQNSSTHGTETNPETTSNVQVQSGSDEKKRAGDAVHPGRRRRSGYFGKNGSYRKRTESG